VLANLCIPPTYAPAAEGIGVNETRPASPADVARLGVRIQVFNRRVTHSAPATSLKRVCIGRTCVLFRSSCAPGGLVCTYQEWPIARAAIRAATLIPLLEIRIEAANLQARRSAERALQLVSEDRRGRTFIPLSRLSPTVPLTPAKAGPQALSAAGPAPARAPRSPHPRG
jgi:hypothetical protein